MLQGGVDQKKVIELTDNELETGQVINHLFDIMIKDKNILDIPHTDSTLPNPRRSVVLFAQKYDFINELRIIGYQLQVALSNHDPQKRDPRSIFDIGLLLDKHELCKNALKTAGSGWNYNSGCEAGQEKEFGEVAKGAKLFDLAACGLAGLREMPIEIVWALLRASHKPSAATGVLLQAEYDTIAANYGRLIALKGTFIRSWISSISLMLLQVPPNSRRLWTGNELGVCKEMRESRDAFMSLRPLVFCYLRPNYVVARTTYPLRRAGLLPYYLLKSSASPSAS